MPSEQVVPTGPAQGAPLCGRGRRRGGLRYGGPRYYMQDKRGQGKVNRSATIVQGDAVS